MTDDPVLLKLTRMMGAARHCRRKMPVTSSMRAAQEGGNREDVAAAHQGTRARSGPKYSRTAGRGRGVSPAGRWLTVGARSKGHSRRPLAKSSGQAGSRLKCEPRVCSGTRMHCNACHSLPINTVPACAAAICRF